MGEVHQNGASRGLQSWPLSPRHSVHLSDLVILIADPDDLRFGEIAAPTYFFTDTNGMIRLHLRFWDAHEHDDWVPSIGGSSAYLAPSRPCPEVYYRHAPPLTPGGELMIARSQGLRELVTSYERLSRVDRPGKERASWLNRGFLDIKYRFIFSEPLPWDRVSHNGQTS